MYVPSAVLLMTLPSLLMRPQDPKSASYTRRMACKGGEVSGWGSVVDSLYLNSLNGGFENMCRTTLVLYLPSVTLQTPSAARFYVCMFFHSKNYIFSLAFSHLNMPSIIKQYIFWFNVAMGKAKLCLGA